MKILLILLLLIPVSSFAEYTDSRYCGEPERYENGRIKRNMTLLREFQKLYPCPSTGSKVGPCQGWAKDHVIPLSVGGCDSIVNLQWLPNEIKSSSGSLPKDRWEREVYKWQN